MCRALVAVLCLLMSSLSAGAETLVLGSVNDNVRKHLDRFTPLALYLAQELAADGVDDIQISVLPSSTDMAAALRDGRVDLYFDSPLIAARVAQESGAVPMLRRWKRGVSTYHSVIVVPMDSPLQTIGDLAGRKIGFQEPDSTSGFLLPVGLIDSAGLTLQELASRHARPEGDAVGYVFTGDDKNTLLWLAKGWIDAAATDPRGFAMLDKSQPDRFRVIEKSMDVPRQVVVRRAGLEVELSRRIKDVLIGMEATEEGRKVMKKFHKTTKFDAFPNGVDATFAPMYGLLDRLEILALY
ncbi:phosphate/phosphite/phosphonate ABC transporter substrate-binding protein [Tropicimonas marinistellae]|uniref:phosphate/phosphite/phosphonate ABC transporter substrate-binding protein n=1 Tax=Tropicimonas marinistellae TaxID=1739787 RepID=UPI00082FEAC8|nr:phosphate/phosphite/phosphonate ABC transporter substrate-binding protein [Tropicimonas marinistellae]